jgi:tetratricopeptide (TPR) repeat protein
LPLVLAATLLTLSPAQATSDERDAALQAHQGRAALIRHQYQEAERLLTQALDLTALPVTTKIFAFDDRGVARWRLHDLSGAVDDFNAALRLAPEEATLYNNRGNVLLELNLKTEAVKDFTTAIALAPDYGEAYNNRGNTRLLLGDGAGAVADFTKAIRLMPGNAVPFNGRGKAQLALRRPGGALRDLSRAIAISGRYGQAYANRADALLALRRYLEAIADYNSAVQFGTDNARVHLGRASAYEASHKPDLALAGFAEAMARDPSLVPSAELHRPHQVTAARSTGAAGPALATATASDPQATMMVPCDDAKHPADRDPHLGPPGIVDVVPASLPSSLLHTAREETGGYLAEATSQDSDNRLAQPCGRQSSHHADDPSAASASPVAGTGLDGWSTDPTPEGDTVATNSDYPALRVTLEMYGSGVPELLSWERLKGALHRIGLLHYFAGTTPEGERLEYIAMVDIKGGEVMAIEPGRWGERQADWSWSDLAVVVVDPQGIPSRVELREENSFDHPRPLRRVKHVRRYIPPQFSQRSAPRIWPHAGDFNPWHFR